MYRIEEKEAVESRRKKNEWYGMCAYVCVCCVYANNRMKIWCLSMLSLCYAAPYFVDVVVVVRCLSFLICFIAMQH